jgi:tRNA splicing ligase
MSLHDELQKKYLLLTRKNIFDEYFALYDFLEYGMFGDEPQKILLSLRNKLVLMSQLEIPYLSEVNDNEIFKETISLP